MTVSTEVSHNEYTGNGVTTSFPYQFRILNKADLVVQTLDANDTITTLVLDTDYTVTNAGSYTGGTVVLPSPLANGWRITIDRVLDVVQETDLRNQGAFFPEVHENEFDYLTMLIQQCFGWTRLALLKPNFLSKYFDARQNRISNLNDPQSLQDAVNYRTAINLSSGGASGAILTMLADTSNAANGDALIGVRQPTPNAAPLTQHDVNLRTISIQDYGNPRAKDDYTVTSGTNCWSALQAIFTDFPNGCKIRFPKTVGGNGHYYMNGTMTWPDMSKYIIDPDHGVDITHEGGGTPLIGAGLVVTRPLNIILPTLGYTYRLSPTPYGPLSGKPYFISSGDGESPVVEKILANSELAFYTVNPATGASSGASASGDADIVTFSNIPTGQFIVGSVPVRPGWEAHALVTMPGATASIAIYVQTERGFVIYSQPIGGGDITRYVFREGYPVQSVTIPNPVQDNPAYNFEVSEIGIKVHSPTSFSILCNHSEVARMEGLPYNIIRAGWGAGIANNTNAAYITYPVRVKNNKTYGMRPLRVVIVGDSTADKNNHISWVNHMVRVSSGVGGLQFKNILNLAVAGQTAVQQAAIFNSTNFVALGGFDYALIDVGINDIAGGSTADQFITAITSIITTCQTYNIIPIIGIPALWYNGSAAVPFGQTTGSLDSNAVRGASYRLRLLRTLSDLGVQVAMLPLQDMGAIVPSLLVHPELDPVVQDNLHPSGFGAQLKGGGWAKAFIGYLFCRTRTNISPTEIMPGWIPSAISSSYGIYVKPKFEVVGNEFGLTGLMDCPTPVPNNTTILQLPQAYAPLSQLYIPLTCFDGSSIPLQSVATLRIDTSGAFVVNNVPTAARYFALGNCRYNLPQ